MKEIKQINTEIEKSQKSKMRSKSPVLDDLMLDGGLFQS